MLWSHIALSIYIWWSMLEGASPTGLRGCQKSRLRIVFLLRGPSFPLSFVWVDGTARHDWCSSWGDLNIEDHSETRWSFLFYRSDHHSSNHICYVNQRLPTNINSCGNCMWRTDNISEPLKSLRRWLNHRSERLILITPPHQDTDLLTASICHLTHASSIWHWPLVMRSRIRWPLPVNMRRPLHSWPIWRISSRWPRFKWNCGMLSCLMHPRPKS